jgi:hypothetical protein
LDTNEHIFCTDSLDVMDGLPGGPSESVVSSASLKPSSVAGSLPELGIRTFWMDVSGCSGLDIGSTRRKSPRWTGLIAYAAAKMVSSSIGWKINLRLFTSFC